MSHYGESAVKIYETIQRRIDLDDLKTIDSAEDIGTEAYKKITEEFINICTISRAKRISTVYLKPSGDIEYGVDYYDGGESAPPGTMLQTKYIDRVKDAIFGTNVLPNIIRYESGNRTFNAYFTLKDSTGKIAGVLMIIFSAEEEARIYTVMGIITVAIIVLGSILSIFIARSVFKRISNPKFQDMANTDSLTGLKNRNAYDLDLSNINQRSDKSRLGCVEMDLNALKTINDHLGHEVGDKYIQYVGEVIKKHSTNKIMGYRIGGDEFAILFLDSDLTELEKVAGLMAKEIEENKNIFDDEYEISVAHGYALFDIRSDKRLEDTMKRADQRMYVCKGEQHFKTQHDPQ